MDIKDEIERLIKEYGGELVRTKTHNVYRFPNGRMFVISKTTEDHFFGPKKALADLRRILGIRSDGTPGERRERRLRHRSIQELKVSAANVRMDTFSDKLRAARAATYDEFLILMKDLNVKPLQISEEEP